MHSERLSAIGELIAGVAHEINNPLQTIIGCTELMLDEPDGANRHDLELVRKEAMRAGQIVRNLLAFARRGAPDRTTVDLNDLVRATAELREYHLRQINIDLTVRCAPAPLPVVANREEIRQVILNLLLNAEHAIASSESERAVDLDRRRSTSSRTRSSRWRTAGPASAPELRGRIFEPFFTTREVGEGTGLGLSISLGIASAHGGALTLVDSPEGARFRLSLPLPSGVAPPANVPLVTAAPQAIVIDDDEPIRKLVAKLLERRGFEVREAETGKAAMALALAKPPDVVICDKVPDTSPLELYRAMLSERTSTALRADHRRQERRRYGGGGGGGHPPPRQAVHGDGSGERAERSREAPAARRLTALTRSWL